MVQKHSTVVEAYEMLGLEQVILYLVLRPELESLTSLSFRV